MTRDQLEHLLRAAADVTGVVDLVVIGSQAVLGTYPEHEPPVEATMSREADIAVDIQVARVELVGDSSDLADQIEGALGAYSRFAETFGYWAKGVEVDDAHLADGWRDRLVAVNVDAFDGDDVVAVGWCLDVNDLWVSKAAAARDKDFDYCNAVAAANLVDRDACQDRIALLADPRARSQATAVFERAPFPTSGTGRSHPGTS